MISLDKIDSDISELEKTAQDDNKSYRTLMLLRELRMYMLTEPDESKLRLDIEKLNRKINAELNSYEYWLSWICNPAVKIENRKAKFMSESDIPKMRRQLKNIGYILGEIECGKL
jgi:hypothetical protein